MIGRCLLLALTSIVVAPVYALELPKIFSDHMVLQQEQPIPVWGKADSGRRVVVTFRDQSVTAQADQDGLWEVSLNAEVASFVPELLSVSDGSQTIQFEDVLVGEVWLCSGQSNMDWSIAQSGEADIEILAANFPYLRLYKVERNISEEPRFSANAVWMECSSETVMNFSAVGYSFGRDLRQVLDVPVGLIHSAWGGTPAISWTREQVLDQHPLLLERKMQAEDQLETYPSRLAAWEARKGKSTPAFNVDPGIAEEFSEAHKTSFDDRDWGLYSLPGPIDWVWEGADGAVWFRRTFELPESVWGERLFFTSGPIDDFDMVWANGELIGEMDVDDQRTWETPRRYEIPAELTELGRVTIAMRVFDHFGGGHVGNAYTTFALDASGVEEISLSGEWRYAVELSLPAAPGPSGGNRKPRGGPEDPHRPGVLANGMLATLAPYAIRGAIWYQGETDAGWHPSFYDERLKVMIEDWRDWWGIPDMPFGIVQLAAYMQPKEHPSDDRWPNLREAQRDLSNDLVNTGLAVTIDIGESNDIHPANKREVGRRLARWALADIYDLLELRGGPELDTVAVEGSEVTLTFSQFGAGLHAMNGPSLKGFTVAGVDGEYHFADASIKGNNQVVLASTEVESPKYVRYAWQNNPVGANLFNKERLPASPFEVTLIEE